MTGCFMHIGPTPEQWNTYRSDTKVNTKKRKKEEQKLDTKKEFKAIPRGDGKINKK